MKPVKQILKAIIPLVVLNKIRKYRKPINQLPDGWSGNYTTWREAKKFCTGYNSSLILKKCKDALLKVKNGDAVYERDSVIFDEIQYSQCLLEGLQKAALENDNKLCILDFGGSLGSTYFQNKRLLSSIKKLTWCIVEQTHFVNCGKRYFEDEQLKFYHTIEECIAKHKPNVLLLSGVLQYLEKPGVWVEKFIKLKIPTIIIDRTTIINCERNIITVQKVPYSIYEASYPCWFFNEDYLKKLFINYSLITKFESYCDMPITLNSEYNATWAGFEFKLSNLEVKKNL